jgi:4-amino-4-deoxy-L-arabinose transferase-like glycosyltransferase
VLLLFWLLSSYFFWKALENNKTCHWLAFGLCLGIGSLGKYAMLFFIPIIFLYLTLYNKKTLSNPMLYVSIVIGIMIFSPVIYWNIQHQFIGFKHLQHLSGFENVTNPTEWSLKNIFDFFLGQLLIMSPLFLVCYYHIVRCRKKDAINSYFILPILFIWTIFLFISIIKKHEANVNWTMFVYVPLPIMLASYIVDAHRQKTARVLTSITIFLFLTTLTVPAWTNEKVNKVLPPAADPLKKLSCWKEIAQQVNSVCKQHKDTQKLFVFTEDYMLTSQLLFYMYPQQNIYFFNNGSRMCQNQLWKGIEQFSNKGYDGILVECNTIKGKSEPANLPINVATAFHRVTAHKRTVFYYRGEPAYDVDIYYLKGFTSIEAMTANHY